MTAMTHAEKVLMLLSGGHPHSYREGYGLGVMLHSRVADLRKQGHDIRCWRDGDDYLYQLTVQAGTGDGKLGGASLSLPGPPAERPAPPGPDSPFPLSVEGPAQQLTVWSAA